MISRLMSRLTERIFSKSEAGPIVVGDTVRAYDYPDRDDSFIEGVVLMTGRHGAMHRDCDRHTITISRIVRNNRDTTANFMQMLSMSNGAEHAPLARIPVNGTPTNDGKSVNRVIRIS